MLPSIQRLFYQFAYHIVDYLTNMSYLITTQYANVVLLSLSYHPELVCLSYGVFLRRMWMRGAKPKPKMSFLSSIVVTLPIACNLEHYDNLL